MQDNWQDFDRQIKSVMQDAREKVPGRVWRAVSGRLDSAARAAAWWKWAVPAFAVAALVAGLFLTGTFYRSAGGPDNIQIIADSGVSQETPAGSLLALAPEQETSAEAAEEAASAPVRNPRRKAAPAPAAPKASDAPDASAQQAGMTEPSADAPSQPVQQEEQAQTPSGNQDSQDAAAQWARIMQEDNTRSSSVRLGGLYARGGLGGNDSNISYGGNGISRMAPGAGSPDAGISESGPSTYGVPFTVGLGARFSVTDRLSFGTGLDYSMLTRSFKGTYTSPTAAPFDGTIFHTVHYIGVPVNVYYNLLDTRDGLMNVYAWGGGSADYCIANGYKLMGTPATTVKDEAGGFQFSAALGIGLEFKLTDRLGLYLDPAVRYYFHSPGQPKSVRTDKPFMFNLDAGLRFSL